MKNRILTAILSAVILLSFAGCSSQTIKNISDKAVVSTSSADVTSNTEISNGIPAEKLAMSVASEITTEEETTAPPSESSTFAPTQNAEQPSAPAKQDTHKEQSAPPKSTDTPTTSATQIPLQTTALNEAESTVGKPDDNPETTNSAKPTFDINYWIAYAKSYAQSVGLRLDSSAVDCWDNPISANAKCKYLERDIQSRLNRYSRDEDITDVWIWAEKVSDNSYEIYIGYA